VEVEVLLQQLELEQVGLAALVTSMLEELAQRVQEQALELEAVGLVIQAQDQQVQEKMVAMAAPVGAVGVLLPLVELAALVEMALFIFITKERNGYEIRISMSHL
jgi:alkylation response protein AidB-like acyl-CoA dehydrogenase